MAGGRHICERTRFVSLSLPSTPQLTSFLPPLPSPHSPRRPRPVLASPPRRAARRRRRSVPLEWSCVSPLHPQPPSHPPLPPPLPLVSAEVEQGQDPRQAEQCVPVQQGDARQAAEGGALVQADYAVGGFRPPQDPRVACPQGHPGAAGEGPHQARCRAPRAAHLHARHGCCGRRVSGQRVCAHARARASCSQDPYQNQYNNVPPTVLAQSSAGLSVCLVVIFNRFPESLSRVGPPLWDLRGKSEGSGPRQKLNSSSVCSETTHTFFHFKRVSALAGRNARPGEVAGCPACTRVRRQACPSRHKL